MCDSRDVLSDSESVFYAHWDHENDRRETLPDHLQAVANLAGRFAESFNAKDWGYLAGLWHDVGKYSRAFQNYLRGANGTNAHIEGPKGKVDHSAAGAVLAIQKLEKQNPIMARILAYCIAGHHAGLADWRTNSDGSLKIRLAKNKSETQDALQLVGNEVPEPSLPQTMTNLHPGDHPGFTLSFFTRMLFSCLADADFLSTEVFMDSQRTLERTNAAPSWEVIENRLRSFLTAKQKIADASPINDLRQKILQACIEKASETPGIFSLTVPTGGGKTLSSLYFAVRHAQTHRMNRIVYGIPFTSIIEQNAEVFREALGEWADLTVLEHHSNFDPRNETPWNRLAAENWDAPLVVTTNVQLLESLFASRTSRCRKLHNLVGSVIILDEAQTLPVEFLEPSLRALTELVRNYRCSLVLCTATQPAIVHREEFSIGINEAREIAPDPVRLYAQMRRVEVKHIGKLSDDELAMRIQGESKVLCIVNTKKAASSLYRRLPDDGSRFHLNAMMCPRHRSAVLRTIKHRLDQNKPCRVVSTQLIEAGVDIDFPVVYRAMAGLDSIAQAAGRCNREGKLEQGHVFVYDAEDPPPIGHLRQTAETGKELISIFEDLLSPPAIQRYFELHYWKQNTRWDHKKIMKCFEMGNNCVPISNFREAANNFRLIPNETTPVLIPWSRRGRKLVETLRNNRFPDRSLRRSLQRYSVSVRQHEYRQLEENGALAVLHEQYSVLDNMDFYQRDIGLSPRDATMVI